MPKTNLQQQAVSLIEQLSAEKLKMAVDYLTYLYDKELGEAKQVCKRAARRGCKPRLRGSFYVHSSLVITVPTGFVLL